ncbi:MAG TPA: hypothetical protein EYP63_02480, partial [Desulfotomaculum sp.]|nr:hypothetical protein [Desulfotomaculum sp.]
QTRSIPPGGEVEYTVEVRIPDETPAGLYRLYAVADPYDCLEEYNEYDNIHWRGIEIRLRVHEPTECAPKESTLPKEAIFRIGDMSYSRDGQTKEMDVAPFIKDGRTQVPVRHLSYALGLTDQEIGWDPVRRRVTLTRGPTCVELIIGQPVIIVNGTEREMDVAPLIVQGRTFLPARYVAEAFGAAVAWDEATRTVRVGTAVEEPLNQTAEYLGV